MDQALRGDPIVSHNGVDYGFLEADGSSLKDTALFVPSEKGYQLSKLQRIIQPHAIVNRL
jgi:hypothetical protein